MRIREIIADISAFLRSIRNWYDRLPYVQRTVTITTAALCVFAAASIYAIGKDVKESNNPASRESVSETSPGDNTQPNQPPPPSERPLPPAPAKRADFPSDRLNLTNWKIALPIDTAHFGTPDEIEQPEITKFKWEPYFMSNPSGDGVIFRAHAGGATTKNSDYPRSELREMTSGGREEASWSNKRGTHSMTVRQAVTHLPDKKPEVVTAQIHDGSDDIVMVRLEKNRLFVQADGEDIGDLEANYRLGTPYTVTITAENGEIRVVYNGKLKVTYEKSGSTFYFKAGCYTQTNPDRGDSESAYGEVVIYDLSVSHSR